MKCKLYFPHSSDIDSLVFSYCFFIGYDPSKILEEVRKCIAEVRTKFSFLNLLCFFRCIYFESVVQKFLSIGLNFF